MHFSALLASVVAALTIAAAASPTTNIAADSDQMTARLVSDAELDHWLATTDANVTYIGDGVDKRTPFNTRVTYCNRRSGSVCGGSCTYYDGGARCLNAPGTQCLFATNDVSFCDRGGCSGSCNQFNSCGTRLGGNFCFTPGTNSITVSPL